ncbi:MAG: epoxide hydrolase N-terminal domain-containing protein, partial [Aquabacterium sp.]
MASRPFAIDVPQAVLDDLKRRLQATRWPEPIPGSGWDYGADMAWVRELCAYWQDGYDWRRHEAVLNCHPQFLCEVDGVDIQYWHVRGRGPRPFPLLLIHGWPGSMVEFL